jgi:phosphatidylinositol alpha-mannosyltransferase
VKIALACPYAWDLPGGVQTHVRQLSACLRARGHQTLILAPGWTQPSDPDVVIVGRPFRIPFNGSVAPVCPDPRSRSRIRGAMAQFGPDVVHAHEPFSPSTGFFATIDAPAPVVAVSHTYFERSVLFDLFTRAFARVWKRPAVWVGVSQASARFLRRYVGPDADVRVIPNGVDVEAFRNAKPLELPPGRRMLFVGRLEPRKGLQVALAAFARLAPQHPDLYLVVAGEGRERSALDRTPPEVRSRVIELGTVPHADLPRCHAAADVFVSPATGRESFGIVLVEAMAAGLPVVASDIPGYREVVRAGVDGLLVPPGDPQALAEAVGTILTDRDLAQRLSAAARERADAFRWEIVAEGIEAASRDAIHRRS